MPKASFHGRERRSVYHVGKMEVRELLAVKLPLVFCGEPLESLRKSPSAGFAPLSEISFCC